MSVESSDRVMPSRSEVSEDPWSQIAGQAYERDSRAAGIQLAASACNPKLDIPITPADRLLPAFEPMNTPFVPIWRMGDGCRQIPRRPGAA